MPLDSCKRHVEKGKMKNLAADASGLHSESETTFDGRCSSARHLHNPGNAEAFDLIQAASSSTAKAIAALSASATTATAQRRLLAIQLCLTSVTGLLEISESLLQDIGEPTPYQQASSWQRLSEDAKGAGRAAYKAVLILADPVANHTSDLAPRVQRLN